MSDNHEHLAGLSRLEIPEADAAARQRALDAAMSAFAAAGQEQRAPQGKSFGQRLRSILRQGRTWIMDARIPVGTAALVLLLLPLGYQLYSSTALSPQLPATVPARTAVPEAEVARKALPQPAAPAVQMSVQEAAPAADALAPAPMARESFAPQMLAQQTRPSGDTFAHYDENGVKVVAEAPVSTFSIDVDTASYSYVRRMLSSGVLPEPDAVRIEELVNYFPYDYPAATSAAEPFQPSIAIMPTPWNDKTELLRIGIKGYEPPAAALKPANLVFLVDTSGSMDEPDKLPLLKRALALLVERMGEKDTIAIVAYAGSAGVVLEPTPADEKAKILSALDSLTPSGSTAGAEGIALAYQLAGQSRIADGTNRVILATDGDFNVGIDDPEKLKDFIAQKRDSGITLSVLGFGEGNLDDATMQALAQNGNGNAAYIDSFKEARKVLVNEAGGTLTTIAQDVKIQVEFNPATVSEYRLIGYESRALNREDFNNDKVDAGDVGAGTTVTALYEITPKGSGGELVDPLRYGDSQQAAGSDGELAYLKLRYKLPGETASKLIETPITRAMAVGTIAEAPADLRFAAAVAAFGQSLKDSAYGTMPFAEIADLARGARGPDPEGYRSEFVQLAETAGALKGGK
jgi:Ca-activated chloride channel family protein